MDDEQTESGGENATSEFPGVAFDTQMAARLADRLPAAYAFVTKDGQVTFNKVEGRTYFKYQGESYSTDSAIIAAACADVVEQQERFDGQES